eukprot:scaffold138607_cov96-Cyclotella_meneghiniana.AAC.1
MACDCCLKAPTLAISTPAAAAIIRYLQRQSPPTRITSWAQNHCVPADCCIHIIRIFRNITRPSPLRKNPSPETPKSSPHLTAILMTATEVLAPTLAISTPAAAAIIRYLQRQSPPTRITSWAQNHCVPFPHRANHLNDEDDSEEEGEEDEKEEVEDEEEEMRRRRRRCRMIGAAAVAAVAIVQWSRVFNWSFNVVGGTY